MTKKVCSLTIAVLLFAVTLFAVLFNQNSFSYADEQSDLETELAAKQKELDIASRDYGDAMLAKEQAEAVVADSENKINAANEEMKTVQNKLCNRMREVYRNNYYENLIDMLVGADNLQNFFWTLDAIQHVNDYDTNLIKKNKELRDTISSQMGIQTENLRIAQEKSNEAAKIQGDAQAAVNGIASRLEQIKTSQQASSSIHGGGVSPTPPPPGSNEIVSRAYGELGKPYEFGAVGPGSYDCSGLVSYCVSGAHTRIGTTTIFMGWPSSEAVPGAICTSSYHCGVYIGGGQMINATMPGDCVRITPVQDDMIFVHP